MKCFEGIRDCFGNPPTIKGGKDVHATYLNNFKKAKQPIRVAVTGVAGQIGYALLPMIASGNMFGPDQEIIIQGLDLDIPVVKDNLRGIKMELEDGHYPLVKEVIFTTDANVAFKGADYAVMLGSFPRKEGMERKDLMEKNIAIFKHMGEALERNASKNIKILVVGNPANTNCLVCAKFAPSVPKENFSALTRLDHNRALGQIALKAGVTVGRVQNTIIWGNHSSTQYPDVTHGTVDGKAIFDVLSSHKSYLRDAFISDIQKRGAKIITARKASSALSAARAVVNHIKTWHCGTDGTEWVSMGIITDGTDGYGIDKGLCYSFPVKCKNGKYEIVKGLQIDDFSRQKMKITEDELKEERDLAFQLTGR